MKNSFVATKNISRYLRRIVAEYRRADMTEIADVIAKSEPLVREDTHEDGSGDSCGHELVLLLSERMMQQIPLGKQSDIERQLEYDLNEAVRSVPDEYLWNVRFDYLDEDDAAASELNRTQASEDIERIWGSEPIRLFISHRDSFKKQVGELASVLRRQGISPFVAHDSIEPDEDWQKEIEIALQSMDALLAIVTEDFFDSVWTNQEIGFALGRRIPMISITFGDNDPEGFILKKQAIKGLVADSEGNAERVIKTLKKRLINLQRYREWVVDQFVNAGSYIDAGIAFDSLALEQELSAEEVGELVRAFNRNDQLRDCYMLTNGNRFLNWINGFKHEAYRMNGRKIVEV